MSARLLFDDMARLQHAAMINPPVRRDFVARGLCGDHLWYLLDLTSPRAVADLGSPLQAPDCVACAMLAACEAEIVSVVRAALDESGRDFPVGRLCVRHLGLLVVATSPATASGLLSRWAVSVEALAGQLDTLVAKIAARDRSLGAARSAPMEAVGRLASGRGGGRAPR